MDKPNPPQSQLIPITIRGMHFTGGEAAYHQVEVDLMEPHTVTTGYQGGSRGVSFRICKGMSWRVGSHRGHVTKERAMTPVSSGSLVFTNENIIFLAATKAFTIPWRKITACEVAPDLLLVGVGEKIRTFHCKNLNPETVQACASSYLPFEPLIYTECFFSKPKRKVGCFSTILKALVYIFLTFIVIGIIATKCAQDNEPQNTPAEQSK